MLNWAELKQMIRGALFFENETFEALRDDEDGFARGLKFVVTLGLVVGLVLALAGYLMGLGKTAADELQTVRDTMDQQLEMMESFGAFQDDEVASIIMDYMDAGLEIAEDVTTVVEETTIAPMPVATLFEAIGKWLSYPFGWISLWLFWGILTLIFARLLGGTATIQQMLATTSLVAAPHLLDALGFIPCGGFLLQALAFFWGLAIYVKATAVANRMHPTWIALLAVLGPLIVAVIIVFFTLPVIVLLAWIF